MYKTLIVEDDAKLSALLKETLEKYEYQVNEVTDFKAVEEKFSQVNPDLVLLDINLPYYDGFYFCRIFRKKSKAPILIISARDDDTHQIMGMEVGADDYITKPFSTSVLIAKVNAAIRRSYGEYAGGDGKSHIIRGLELDEKSFRISFFGKACELSKNEMKLLKKLMENAGKVVSREELLGELWDDSVFVDDNTLTVNVTRVKAKLASVGVGDAVKTKRGAGYLFDTEAIKEQES